jgi:AcrR family transcriptional regulator
MPETRERYHHGNLRNTLIKIAAAILESEGIKVLSLRAVARSAGVSQAAPYRHFADREALLAAVAAYGFGSLAAAMTDVAVKFAPGETVDVRALGVVYVDFATDHPNLFRLMFTHEISDWGDHPELVGAAKEAYGIINDAVSRRLAESGTATIHPELAAVAGWAGMHGLATLIVDGQLQHLMTGGVDRKIFARALT